MFHFQFISPLVQLYLNTSTYILCSSPEDEYYGSASKPYIPPEKPSSLASTSTQTPLTWSKEEATNNEHSALGIYKKITNDSNFASWKISDPSKVSYMHYEWFYIFDLNLENYFDTDLYPTIKDEFSTYFHIYSPNIEVCEFYTFDIIGLFLELISTVFLNLALTDKHTLEHMQLPIQLQCVQKIDFMLRKSAFIYKFLKKVKQIKKFSKRERDRNPKNEEKINEDALIVKYRFLSQINQLLIDAQVFLKKFNLEAYFFIVKENIEETEKAMILLDKTAFYEFDLSLETHSVEELCEESFDYYELENIRIKNKTDIQHLLKNQSWIYYVDGSDLERYFLVENNGCLKFFEDFKILRHGENDFKNNECHASMKNIKEELKKLNDETACIINTYEKINDVRKLISIDKKTRHDIDIILIKTIYKLKFMNYFYENIIDAEKAEMKTPNSDLKKFFDFECYRIAKLIFSDISIIAKKLNFTGYNTIFFRTKPGYRNN